VLDSHTVGYGANFGFRKNLPLILPIVVFLFDIGATVWMISHEPALNNQVVRRWQIALRPGILVFPALPAIVFNCAVATSLGYLARLVPTKRK